MYHPETAYEFGKARVRELERSTLEGSTTIAWLARLVRSARGRSRA